MVETVTASDIEEYIENKYGESVDGLSDPRLEHLPDDVLFEAFADLAVDKNPAYEINTLTERWEDEHQEVGISKHEFAVKVFNELISEDVYTKMSCEQKDAWISATVQGMSEVANTY